MLRFIIRQMIALLAISAVIKYSKKNIQLTVLLLFLGAVWCFFQSQNVSLLFFFICAILFPCVESVCIKVSPNTWKYAYPMQGCNIPLWLFPCWGLASGWVLDVRLFLDYFNL